MQTFLPYPGFTESLACLDYRRLGKQRVEARQIYNTLTGTSSGWANHPAVRMWANYLPALAAYHNLAIATWVSRGYNNTMLYLPCPWQWEPPHWLTPDFCASHRSNLLRKDPDFYSQYAWSEPHDLPYLWPV